jgi:molybdopterin molybdotransferase
VPRRIAQPETISSFDALGRVLAADVMSTLDVPPADNTSMDGYALRAADVPVAGTVLAVSQRIPAGVVGAALQPGTAARIFTGGQVPQWRRCRGDAGAMRRIGLVMAWARSGWTRYR